MRLKFRDATNTFTIEDEREPCSVFGPIGSFVLFLNVSKTKIMANRLVRGGRGMDFRSDEEISERHGT